ncbi:amino acid deaminase [Rhodococcus sp. T2V]|uniref:amino acid deaminase n=1 Tax=Rhodococcus sp. T2V TaxID=3034164 RepID=UPI0023E103ED|nr:amino acid deaminase [Rhodococcus sp. T2V]MDF3309999.1 amino acid deaminase [Rhodococcus sp. T2V]
MTISGTDALDSGALAELDELRLSDVDKALPSAANGHTKAEFLATRPRLSAFSTPVMVLDETAIAGNLDTMAAWCRAHGVDLAPHGKTTMSPVLWDRQIRGGAWGITLANFGQLRVAVRFGARRVQIANSLVDPTALRWLAEQMEADPELEVLMWADSPQTVDAMTAALAGVTVVRPLPVLVELGGAGGRTGARSVAEAVAVAERIGESPALRLAGVSGYEGALAHDASEESLARVRAYLRSMAELHRRLQAEGRYPEGHDVYVTAGGSAYFDVVAEVLAELAGGRTKVVVRAGAYIIHDDGFYTGITPFARARDEQERRLTSAMHTWARVVSRPEPGLALLDAGKRDVPFDEGLPTAQAVAGALGATPQPLVGAEVTAVNDQHAFLRLDPARPEHDLRVGDVVRLGLSHPCTAFDKWRWIPVVGDDSDDPVVVDLIRTFF